MDFNIEQALQQGASANSLILKDTLLNPETLCNLMFQQITSQKQVLHNSLSSEKNSHRRDLCKFYHRFFFTYPLLLDPTKKRHSCNFHKEKLFKNPFKNAALNSILYEVEPQFTELDPGHFEDSFNQLDSALQIKIDQLSDTGIKAYVGNVRNLFTGKVYCDSERSVYNSCKYPFLNLLQFTNTGNILKYEYNGISYMHMLVPSLTVEADGKTLLVVDKCNILNRFITRNETEDRDQLITTHPEFNTILKRLSSYLIATNLEVGLVTDCKVTLVIKPNLLQVSETNVRDIYPVNEENKVNIPFEYKVIRNTDCGITVQAVMASILYQQLKSVSFSKKLKLEPLPVPLKTQLKLLKIVLTMSAQHQRQVISANINIQAKKLSTKHSPKKYGNVDTSRFQEPVSVDIDESLRFMRTENGRHGEIYIFPLRKYYSCFRSRWTEHNPFKGKTTENIPQSAILKVYNFMD